MPASGNEAPSRWWGADVGDITVDVSSLESHTRKRLNVPSCCSGAGGFLWRCGFCCSLTCLLPAALLLTLPLLPELKDSLTTDAAFGIAAGLLCLGLCWCCLSIRRTCCEGIFNLPDPAPPVPPLLGTDLKPVNVRRVLLVYNPNAGKRTAEGICRDVVIPGLQARGMTCEAVATKRMGHAREIAASADLSRFDALVSMGGDGTFHEMVNGLLTREDGQRLPVGLIPLGSGNGFAATFRQNMRRRGAEVPTHQELNTVLTWSLDRLAGGKVAKVDLVEVEVSGRRLVSVMQVYIGLLAEVDIIAEPFRWMGPIRLDLLPVWNILKKQAQRITYKLTGMDGACHSEEALTIGGSIGLTQHFDDSKRAVPHAQLDDGLAEFSLIPATVSRDELFAGFLKLPHGAHTGDRVWQCRQIVEASIDFEGPGVFNVDGEILQHPGSLKLRVLPGELEVLIGEDECACDIAPEEEAQRPIFKAYTRRWGMLGIFCLCSMVNQAIWIGFAPAQSEVVRTCQVSADSVNFLSLIFMIVYVPAALPAAYVIDMFGCRSSLIFGVFLNTLGAILRSAMPLGPGAAWICLVAGQVLCALAQPFFTTMPPKLAAVWFPAYQRAMADTIASISATIGAAIGFILPAAFGLQNMVHIHCGWSVLAALLVLMVFQNAPPTAASPSSDHVHLSFGAELCEAFRNSRLWCLMIAFACGLGAFNSLSTLSEELILPYGFTADDASNMGVLVVAGGVLGAAVMTVVVGYTSRYKAVLVASITICLLSGAVAVLTLKFVGGGSFVGIAIAFFGLGFGAMPVMPVSFEAAVEAAYPVGEGTLACLIMSGGQLVGIIQTEVVSSLLRSGRPTLAWCLSVALFGLALIAVTCFKQKRQRLEAETAPLLSGSPSHRSIISPSITSPMVASP